MGNDIAKPSARDRDSQPFEATEAALAALGEAFWSIVRHYGLSRRETAVVLGVKENRHRLAELEKALAIPDDPDKIQRVGHLVGIHKSLRILFPHNRDVVYAWLKTPSSLFGGLAPLAYIEADPVNSLPRLFKVRRTLDQIRCGA